MEGVVTLFKALADETRLRILKLLEKGELCVCDITTALDMTQPNVSFHLGILKDAGLIKDRKQGRWSYYDLELGEMTNRVVLPTALSKMDGGKVKSDQRRLKEFICKKTGAGNCSLKVVK